MKLIQLSISDAENKKFHEIVIRPRDIRVIRRLRESVYIYVHDIIDPFRMSFMSGDEERDNETAQKYFSEFQKQWESQI